MAIKQGTTVTNESARALGKRDTASLKSAYPESPCYTQAHLPCSEGDESLGTGNHMRAWFDANVLHGSTADADSLGESRANDLFPNYSMDWESNAAPDLTTVGTGDSADLAGGSPYLPNLASPDSTTGVKPANPASEQPAGSSGENGSQQTPAASSAVQSTFSLTNLPAKGSSPAPSTS